MQSAATRHAHDPGVNHALRLAGLLLGVGIVAWLIARADVVTLFDVFPKIGWGFAAIVAVRGATIAIDAAAWRCLLPRGERPPFAVTVRLRWIAESINTTLPAAQIGGDVERARLMQRHLAAPAHGAASVAVDFCLSLFAQILFTLIGFVLLAWLSHNAGWWPIAFTGALLPVFAIASWELLVRRRAFAAVERMALRFGWRRTAVAMQLLGTALQLLGRRHAALALSLTLHVARFLAHAAELWLTLYLMGLPTGFAEATLLESLSLAVRSAAFLIPSGWGAQEGSLIALAGVAGLSGDGALAVGLIKRAREFAVGLPGLAAWGLAEHRHRGLSLPR